MLLHNRGGGRLTCGQCGKRCVSHSEYRHHLSTHTRTLVTFDCPVCDKVFVMRGLRDRHVATHAAEHPDVGAPPPTQPRTNVPTACFTCVVCNQRFASSRSLQTHVKRHTNENRERPFVCDFCGQRFRRKCYRWQHMKIHVNDLSFFCEICQKRFMSFDRLKAHALTHADEPKVTGDSHADVGRPSESNGSTESGIVAESPNVCDICQRKFEDARVFETHKRLHSRLETFYQRK